MKQLRGFVYRRCLDQGSYETQNGGGGGPSKPPQPGQKEARIQSTYRSPRPGKLLRNLN